MSQDRLDLQKLASYLHVAPERVQRMADRGRLPGRKVGGQWQFSQAEIHHWLEERIGASDDEELEKVEGVLQRATPHESAPLISELLLPGAVEPSLPARTRGSVVDKMCALAASTGMLWEPEKMASAVRAREHLHPTALDNGVALLHPRRPMPSLLAQEFLAFGRTQQGIPFGGSRGLTDLFFLILSVNDASHLRVLARLSRLLTGDELVNSLRQAQDEAEMRALISEQDEALEDSP